MRGRRGHGSASDGGSPSSAAISAPSPARTESAGDAAAATRTGEMEPLLGERLLSGASDPLHRIGTNVLTNVATYGSELDATFDTLTYSRDPDESTLLTGDGARRGRLLSLDEGDDRGPCGRWRRPFARDGRDGAVDRPHVLVCLGLAVGIALCAASLMAYVGYDRHRRGVANGGDGAAGVGPSGSEGTWHGVPFVKIGRESFGDPASGFLDVDLFHPSLLHGGGKHGDSNSSRGRRLASDGRDGTSKGGAPTPLLKVPFPTGAFWTNLVLLSENRSRDQYSYPVVAYPYAYQWSGQGRLQASYSASRRVAGSRSIQDSFAPDITLGSTEEVRKRNVVQFDPLSVTLRFYAGGGSGGEDDSSWETYLVQGSPYITAKYSGLAPELTALSDFEDIACLPNFQDGDPGQFRRAQQQQQEQQRLQQQQEQEHHQQQQRQQQQQQQVEEGSKQTSNRQKESLPSASASTAGKKLGVCTVASNPASRTKVVVGVQFVVTTKEGLVWLLFGSEPLKLEFDLAGSRRTIRSREKYRGVIRLALVPPPPGKASTASGTTGMTGSLDLDGLASSPGVKRLVYHAGAYPMGGAVSWEFRPGARAPLASLPHPNALSKKSSNGQGHTNRRMSEHAMRGQSGRKIVAEAPREYNIGTVTFSFKVNHMTSSSSGTGAPLLSLALPHHVASVSSAVELLLHPKEFDLAYESIKGRMVPVVGTAWSYEEELTSVGFGDESRPEKTNLVQNSARSASAGARGAAGSRPTTGDESAAMSALDQSVRDLLLRTVESDLRVNLPAIDGGAYGLGKQVARLAQLAHIARVVDAANSREVDVLVDKITNAKNGTGGRASDPSSASTSESAPSSSSEANASPSAGSGTARRAYALLEKYLTAWLAGDGEGGSGHLAYDAELGGVLSEEGMSDVNADFGNARYNDHHFHYGYVLYAAAVLGRVNPRFVSQYGPRIDALFYDVAHAGGASGASGGDGNGIFFPLARHKSWFDGHSFASGLFPFADGKSQESSSEAVNCYYGAYLWSRVRWADRKVADYARLLLAMEVTGAKTYWHMMPPSRGSGNGGDSSGRSKLNSTVSTLSSTAATGGASLIPVPYNPTFRENYMVGNLGMTDAQVTTWFGTEIIYVHLINFMPVTAISAVLFEKGYVKGEQSTLSSQYDSVESAWRGYSICNEAIVDPNNAWIKAQTLISNQLDPGLSKSQVLFWVSTREGFSRRTTVEVSHDGNGNPQIDHVEQPSNAKDSGANATTNPANKSLASCASHEKCVAENLIGSCCPTNDGVFLQCCT